MSLKLSDLKPAQDLRDRLKASPQVEPPVFTIQEVPTAAVPNEYIAVQLNGAVRRMVSDRGLYEANLLLHINVRLKSDGTINQVMEDRILVQIENALSAHNYVQQMSTVYEGRNLISNYSTKMINLTVRITNN